MKINQNHILIAADVIPRPSNYDIFETGDIRQLLGDGLADVWFGAGARILNLETPLCAALTPIPKYGPNHYTPWRTISGISALNPTAVAMANNHIMDQGREGLEDTVRLCSDRGIPFFGAGMDIAHARVPYIMDFAEKKIAVYACADHEFSLAGESTPGANPFDPLYTPDDISILKEKVDFVIVLYHGGKEYYRYPSPYLQTVCRRLAEKGADIVICQHSHCIGCEEHYSGAQIIYGQGNFLFDGKDNEYCDSGLIAAVSVGDSLSVDYIPIIKKSPGTRIAAAKEAEEIMRGFQSRSRQIEESGFVKEHFEQYASENLNGYLSVLNGKNFASRVINKLGFSRIYRCLYTRLARLGLINMLECEVHREMILTALKNTIK